jgi:hypothetical protein
MSTQLNKQSSLSRLVHGAPPQLMRSPFKPSIMALAVHMALQQYRRELLAKA